MRRALARCLAALPLAAVVLAGCEHSVTTVEKQGRPAAVPPKIQALVTSLTGLNTYNPWDRLQVCSVGAGASYSFSSDPKYPDITSQQSTGSATVPAGNCVTIYNAGNIGGPTSVTNPVTTTWVVPPGVHLDQITVDALGCLPGPGCPPSNKIVPLTPPNPQVTSLTYQIDNDYGIVLTFFYTQLPALTLTKTPDAASVPAGQDIGFKLTLSNAGPGTATHVSITDQLPTVPGGAWTVASPASGCTINASNYLTCDLPDLAPNASTQVHVTSPTLADAAGTACKAYDNTGSAIADLVSAVTSNQATVTVTCSPSITLAKTADAATVSAGSPIGFTVTVTSNGTGPAANVTITDPLPSAAGLSWTIAGTTPSGANCSISAGTLTCSLGSLASGSSVAVHLTSPTTTASCATIDNTASASATGVNPLAATAITTVSCACGTLTIGYWKTHAGFGPQANAVTPLLPQWLGTPGGLLSINVTTAAQAVTLLGMNGKASNPVNKLYAQLLGAKLNIAAGTDGSAAATVISAADAFLATHNQNSSLSAAEKTLVLGWMTTLDNYNSGVIGPGHCGS